MTVISGGKVFERCGQCGKVAQMNKVIGSLHVCMTDCDKAGRHLAVRDMTKGRLWKRHWQICCRCGDEWKKET